MSCRGLVCVCVRLIFYGTNFSILAKLVSFGTDLSAHAPMPSEAGGIPPPGTVTSACLSCDACTAVICWRVAVPAADFTIVTALIDLGREKWPYFQRRFDYYLYYSVQLLRMNVPLVAYVDDRVIDFARHHRRGKEHMTRFIHVANVTELEGYRHYDRISAIMTSAEFVDANPLLRHPEGFSPEYNVLMNSKLSLLRRATAENRFGTRYFFWTDMAYGHGHDIYPKSCSWAPRSIMTGDRITYIELYDLRRISSFRTIYKQKVAPFMNGGFFGGSSAAIDDYYHLYNAVFEDLLDENVVDDDQTVAVACYFRRPQLFNLVTGSWYSTFTLFK